MILRNACLARVRVLLNDNDAGAQRWPDAELHGYMDAALDEFFKLRNDWTVKPDGETATDGDMRFTPGPSGDWVDFVPERYADGVSYGCAARAMETDNADTENARRAAEFFARSRDIFRNM